MVFASRVLLRSRYALTRAASHFTFAIPAGPCICWCGGDLRICVARAGKDRELRNIRRFSTSTLRNIRYFPLFKV
ncbi:hypothetical protein C8R45DRAFT_1038662 [Mycena sanguinolenta]|nr:hypothetical protein C8R45DRAFT_1038662 [Mycena sanguinolenta]